VILNICCRRTVRESSGKPALKRGIWYRRDVWSIGDDGACVAVSKSIARTCSTRLVEDCCRLWRTGWPPSREDQDHPLRKLPVCQSHCVGVVCLNPHHWSVDVTSSRNIFCSHLFSHFSALLTACLHHLLPSKHQHIWSIRGHPYNYTAKNFKLLTQSPLITTDWVLHKTLFLRIYDSGFIVFCTYLNVTFDFVAVGAFGTMEATWHK